MQAEFDWSLPAYSYPNVTPSYFGNDHRVLPFYWLAYEPQSISFRSVLTLLIGPQTVLINTSFALPVRPTARRRWTGTRA